MIPRVHPRGDDAAEALAEALGRPVSRLDGLTEHTVVGHWADLDFFTAARERTSWTSADWAEHLNEPNWQHLIAGPQDDGRAIWHTDIRLHHSDRALTGPEWSETAHRLARTVGIHTPGDGHNCRWIAVQAQHGRLDLIANLIRPDDTWTPQPHRLAELLSHQCRSIEQDLALISPLTRPGPARQARFATRSSATHRQDTAGRTETAAEPGPLLRTLAEENGPLAEVRHLVERAAHRLDDQPGSHRPTTGLHLEWIARRVHGIQEDLRSIADTIPSSAKVSRPAEATPPHAHRTAPPPPTPRGVR